MSRCVAKSAGFGSIFDDAGCFFYRLVVEGFCYLAVNLNMILYKLSSVFALKGH